MARDDFGGAGGAHCGLLEAGYETTSHDNWPTAVATQQINGHQAKVLDLSIDDPPIPAGPWLYWASPPCQPFSAAGDGAGEDDPRDGIPWWLRILSRQLPPVAIMENVKGLTFEKHAVYLNSVLRRVRRYGYRYEWRVLNCADYGVPQTRERFILIARLDGGPIVWPTVTHTEEPGLFTERWVSMADALGWEGSSDTVTQKFTFDADAWSPTFDPREVPSRTVTQVGMRRMVTTRTLRGTLDANREPAATITVKTSGQWIHERPATSINGDTRVSAPGRHDPEVSGSQQAGAIPVTIPELARLQDFPDGYRFTGTKTDQARQIGNAVPRTLARLLAEANRPLAA